MATVAVRARPADQRGVPAQHRCGAPLTRLLIAGAHPGPVLISGDRIASIGAAADADRVIAADGLCLAPGFVDVQINGAFGIDLGRQPDRVWELGEQLVAAGVTAFLPTLPSPPTEAVDALRHAVASRPDRYRGAEPVGLHLEGPMLNPARAGAHDPTRLRPFDVADLSGIRLVTLAPELPGAREVIDRLHAVGIPVAAGHTESDDLSAVDGVTHLFNAMPPVHHRAPGPAIAALIDDRVWVGLIVDGVHVDPLVVRLAERALGDRLVLVSDAVGGATRRPDGVLAGGGVLLDQAVRNLIAWTGCAPDRALAAASAAPARAARLSDRGRIRVGSRADLILLTDAWEVVTTIVGGEVVVSRL